MGNHDQGLTAGSAVSWLRLRVEGVRQVGWKRLQAWAAWVLLSGVSSFGVGPELAV